MDDASPQPGGPRGRAPTSKEAAAAAAAATVLATIDVKTAAEMKVALARSLASIADGKAKEEIDTDVTC